LGNNAPIDMGRSDGVETLVCGALHEAKPELSIGEAIRRSQIVIEDAKLLARCANSACLITYTTAIELRGHGNVQSGNWLDDVYDYALKPLELPDLTLLIVSKVTGMPSAGAFHEGRMKLSGIRPEDVKAEQRRAVAFDGYNDLFGKLEPMPAHVKHVGVASSMEMEREQGVERAVANAVGRIHSAGLEQVRVAKEYPDSLAPDKLRALARRLMREQKGRCALTNTPFDEASEVDRVSLDRIDCDRGYAEGNVQLTTVFANRSRGTLNPEDARMRLVQWSGLPSLLP
jgi:hypothetical protein